MMTYLQKTRYSTIPKTICLWYVKGTFAGELYNKDSMTITIGVDRVTFELTCVYTSGVLIHRNHHWYEIPILLDGSTVSDIGRLAEKYNAVNPVGGDGSGPKFLNLMSYSLSQKQKDELLGKYNSYVMINFTLEGVECCRVTGRRSLSFKVTKLRRTERVSPLDVPPED